MNSTVWDNQALMNTVIHIESGTVQAAYCDIRDGWTGTGNINLNPKLVAEQRSAGTYKLHWDASGLASGVYLCRLVLRQAQGKCLCR